jgi:hypothetical protein
MAFLGVFDKHQIVEEPDEFNDSRPVLKTSRWGDLPAEFTLCGDRLTLNFDSVAAHLTGVEVAELPQLTSL